MTLLKRSFISHLIISISLYVFFALLDIFFTLKGVHGDIAIEGNPIMRYMMANFGVMGGLMQPQGHLQVLLNIIDFGMDVQTALDAPRFRYIQGNECAFEPGFPSDVLQTLVDKGHQIVNLDDPYSQQFGGAQAIMVHPSTKALIAGSDPRKDGCAIGVW